MQGLRAPGEREETSDEEAGPQDEMAVNPVTKLLAKKKRPAAMSAGGGLQVSVTEQGTVSWRFRYRFAGQSEVVTLGRHPEFTLKRAEFERRRLRRRIANGENPAAIRRHQHTAGKQPTVREFANRWMIEVVGKVRKHPEHVERLLAREVLPVFGRQHLSSVTAAEVQRIIFAKRDAGYPIAARNLRNTLKRMFEYARVCQFVSSNPVDATPLKFIGPEHSRTRTLSTEQLRIFFQRLRSLELNRRVALALEVILLTLCRKSELRLARWDHIDLGKGLWEVPAELSKSGQPHVVYLSRQAAARLADLKALAGRAEMVLPARDSVTQPMTPSTINKAMKRIRWSIPNFTPHDLRRTGSTILNEHGYNSDWIEKALNHTVRGVRGVYNRAQYGEQRKRMLQEWADFLEGLR